MRVYDLPEDCQCYRHLNGMHHEIHTIYGVHLKGLKGYSHHPETIRWQGRLWALRLKHDRVVTELQRRWPDYQHRSPLTLVFDCAEYPPRINSLEEQITDLVDKGCGCILYNIRR